MAEPARIVETEHGRTYTCGRCGHREEGLSLDEVFALVESHRDDCLARPHNECPTCACPPRELLVQRLTADFAANRDRVLGAEQDGGAAFS